MKSRVASCQIENVASSKDSDHGRMGRSCTHFGYFHGPVEEAVSAKDAAGVAPVFPSKGFQLSRRPIGILLSLAAHVLPGNHLLRDNHIWVFRAKS